MSNVISLQSTFLHRLLSNNTYESRLFSFLTQDFKLCLRIPLNSQEFLIKQLAFFAINVPFCADEQYLRIRPVCNTASKSKQEKKKKKTYFPVMHSTCFWMGVFHLIRYIFLSSFLASMCYLPHRCYTLRNTSLRCCKLLDNILHGSPVYSGETIKASEGFSSELEIPSLPITGDCLMQ